MVNQLFNKRVIVTGGTTVTLTFESGIPYANFVAWVRLLSGTGVIDVDVQPMFGGSDDGSPVNFAAESTQKVFQMAVDEIRPPTSVQAHPDDAGAAYPLKTELRIINNEDDVVLDITSNALVIL
jgi:hypothetical protein